MTQKKLVPDEQKPEPVHDEVNHPSHYTSHPSGVECIEIVRHMPFNVGNAIKYIFRRDNKDDRKTNLQKAIWYINDEIRRRIFWEVPGEEKWYDTSVSKLVQQVIMHENKNISYAIFWLSRVAWSNDGKEVLEKVVKALEKELEA